MGRSRIRGWVSTIRFNPVLVAVVALYEVAVLFLARWLVQGMFETEVVRAIVFVAVLAVVASVPLAPAILPGLATRARKRQAGDRAGALTPDERDRIRTALKHVVGQNMKCPMCGCDGWLHGQHLVRLAAWCHSDSAEAADVRVLTYPAFCNGCGYTALFNVSTLRAEDGSPL